MRRPIRGTLATLAFALLSLAALAITAVPAWAQAIVDSGGPDGARVPVAVAASGSSSGGTSGALVAGIIVAVALVVLGGALIAVRTTRAQKLAVSADAGSRPLSAVAQPVDDQASDEGQRAERKAA
jgi:hypothetical protein